MGLGLLLLFLQACSLDIQVRNGADTAIPGAVIEVSGRAYPVDLIYRPLAVEAGEEQIDPIRGVADAVASAWESRADVEIASGVEIKMLKRAIASRPSCAARTSYPAAASTCRR